MNVVQIRKPYEFDNNAEKVFHLISYKNTKALPVGSNSMKFNFSNDYDLFNVIHTELSMDALKHQVANTFKNMMISIKEQKNVYFIKFMCGIDDDSKPLFWSVDDVIKGFVIHDNKKYMMTDIFDEYSVIKLDVSAYIDGVFVPFSNVFEFKKGNKGINQEKTTIDDVDSLSKDIKKFYDNKNYMKVLKRLFIISLTTKNKKLGEKLISIFQSDVGKIYQVKSYLESLKDVLEKYHDKDTLQKAQDEMQSLKDTLSKQTSVKFHESVYKLFDVSSQKMMIRNIEKLSEKIKASVNRLCMKSIKSNRINLKKFM